MIYIGCSDFGKENTLFSRRVIYFVNNLVEYLVQRFLSLIFFIPAKLPTIQAIENFFFAAKFTVYKRTVPKADIASKLW